MNNNDINYEGYETPPLDGSETNFKLKKAKQKSVIQTYEDAIKSESDEEE